jgi:lysophospholipase L1-like esterase/dienelactone hydrolase
MPVLRKKQRLSERAPWLTLSGRKIIITVGERALTAMKKTLCTAAVIVLVWSGGAAAQTKIACIGNSITFGWTLTDTTKRYPSVLRTLLGTAQYAVQNDGVNSTTVLKQGNVPYWTNGMLAQVFAFQPAIVTIMLGTNDTKAINWGSYGVNFKRDYEAFIDTLNTLASKPKIFLALPPPIWANTFGIRDSILTNFIMPIIKQIGAYRGLWVIDANTPLRGFSSYFADGVHPNAAGEDTIAHVFYRCITGKPVASRFVGRSHTTAQGTLPYRLYYPYKYNHSLKYPVILTLHGAGERGTDNNAQIALHRLAEIWAEDSMQARHNCFVVAPQCPADPGKWVNVPAWTSVFYSTQSITESASLGIARSLLDSLVREFPVDTNRQYVTGLSMGGYGTWDLIARTPARFAAAVPFSGGLDTGRAPAMRNIPIWTFHGALDGTVPPAATRSIMRTLFPGLGVSVTCYTCQYATYFAGSTMTRAALLSAIDAGAKKLYTEYTDGSHDIWTKSYNDTMLAHWLFLQQKTQAAATTAVTTAGRICKSKVRPVFNGCNVTALFSGLTPGQEYEFRVFDSRGILTNRFQAAASPASRNYTQKMLAGAAGLRWVTVRMKVPDNPAR